MGKRNIDKARVIETMKSPHSVVNGKYGRKIAQKIYGDYLIRVIFEEHEDNILIITAYPSKPRRYLEG